MHSTLALMKALGDKIAKAEKGGKKKKKGAVKAEGHGIGGIGGVQVGVEEGGGSIFGSKVRSCEVAKQGREKAHILTRSLRRRSLRNSPLPGSSLATPSLPPTARAP